MLQLVAEGNTDAQVGAALGLSINTVKVHTKGISKKWHCRNRVHMVIMALQWGLLDLLDLPAVSPSGLSRLTGHEAQVLALLSNNLSARAIAEELGVTAASVHSAEQRIRLKWNAGRRADILELGKRYLQALNDQQTP